MRTAFSVVIEKAAYLPVQEQEALAAILMEEIDSEQRWSKSFANSQAALESLALEAQVSIICLTK